MKYNKQSNRPVLHLQKLQATVIFLVRCLVVPMDRMGNPRESAKTDEGRDKYVAEVEGVEEGKDVLTGRRESRGYAEESEE